MCNSCFNMKLFASRKIYRKNIKLPIYTVYHFGIVHRKSIFYDIDNSNQRYALRRSLKNRLFRYRRNFSDSTI